MSTKFSPIERQTIASSVRDTIEREIRSGAMRAGSPLPSERELSEQFDVARTSVREAVQGLLSLGLLVKKGNRSHVVEHMPEVRIDPVDGRKLRVRELFAVRQILEPPIARLTADNASAAQREHIQNLAQQFEPTMTLEDFRRLDREFHLALALACGNTLLAELSVKVLDCLFSSGEFIEILTARTNDAAVQRTITSSVKYHRQIGEAIRGRDANRAEMESAHHLSNVEEHMASQMS